MGSVRVGGRARTGSRRWIAWLVLVVTFGLIGLLWFGPRLVDWSQYKPEIANLISKQLGVTVELRGGLQIILLPQPRITAANVRVSGPGVDGPIRWLRGSLDPRALFMGRLIPRDLELVEAELRLPLSLATGGTYRGNTSVLIEDSRLQFDGGPDWLPQVLEEIDGRLTLGNGSKFGTSGGVGSRPNRLFAFDGEARMGGQPIGVSIEGSNSGRIALNIAHGPSATDLLLEGAIAEDNAWLGHATLVLEETGFLSTLYAEAITRIAGEGPATLDAAITVAPDGQMDLVLETLNTSWLSGHGTARLKPGSASGTRPAFDLEMTFSRVDFSAAAVDRDQYIRDLARTLETFSGTDITINLSAGALQTSGNTFRDIEISAAAGGGIAVIEHGHVQLPGKSDLRFAGGLNPIEDGWQFDGDANLETADLRTFLTWISPALTSGFASLPDDRFRRATLSAQLFLDTGAAEITELSGQIDDTTWAGALTLPLNDDAAALNAVLQGDRLNLDRYLDVFGSGQADWLISDRDRHIALYLEQATFGGFPADGVALTLAASAGALPVIDATIADLASASGSATMRLDGPSSSQITVRLDVAAPGRFLGAMGVPARQAARFSSFGPTALDLAMSYAPDKGIGYALNAVGENGEGRINGVVELLPIPFITVSDGAYDSQGLTIFDLTGQCAGLGAGAWNCETLAGAMPGLTMTGSATVSVADDGGKNLTLTLEQGEGDLGFLAAGSGLPVTPEGSFSSSGVLTGSGFDIDAAYRNLTGTLTLTGDASLHMRSGNGGQLGNLDRIKDHIATAFGASHPLAGSLVVSPANLDLRVNVAGNAATASGIANLGRQSQQLTGALTIQQDGQADPALIVRASGPVGAPSVRLSGNWISGR